MPTIKIVDNSPYFRHALNKQMREACEELEETVLDSVLWMMMHGYDEPHGDDGHTEIYDTGALYESIETKVAEHAHGNVGARTGGSYGQQYNYTVEVSANTEYASYVHQGTSKLNGRPFITDGIKRVQSDIKKIIQKHLVK